MGDMEVTRIRSKSGKRVRVARGNVRLTRYL